MRHTFLSSASVILFCLVACRLSAGQVTLDQCDGKSLWKDSQQVLEKLGVGQCKALSDKTVSNEFSVTHFAVCGDKTLVVGCSNFLKSKETPHVTTIEVTYNFQNPKEDVDRALAKELARELIPLIAKAFRISCKPLFKSGMDSKLKCHGHSSTGATREWRVSYTDPDAARASLTDKQSRSGFRVSIERKNP